MIHDEEDVRAAVEHTHRQGGVCSINHPLLPGDPSSRGLRTRDATIDWCMGALGSAVRLVAE